MTDKILTQSKTYPPGELCNPVLDYRPRSDHEEGHEWRPQPWINGHSFPVRIQLVERSDGVLVERTVRV